MTRTKRPAPSGKSGGIIVVVGPYCYGSGSTLAAALRAAREQWPNFSGASDMPYNAYECSDDWRVDALGTISASHVVKLAEHRPGVAR